MGTVGSQVSQFATLDESGTVILWVTANASARGSDGDPEKSDLGLSPWGRVRLLQSRVLQDTLPTRILGGHAPFARSSVRPTRGSDARTHDGPSLSAWPTTSAVLCGMPSDPSTLLLSGARGAVKKLVRFGGKAGSHVEGQLRLPTTESLEVTAGAGMSESPSEGSSSSASLANATSISVSPVSAPGAGAKQCLVLVGRTDGSIDLYQMNTFAPLVSWSLSDFSHTPAGGGAVVVVRWCPLRPAAFLAANDAGEVYFFDLLQDLGAPVQTDISGQTYTLLADLSAQGAHASVHSPPTLRMAFVDNTKTVEDGGILLREVRASLVTGKDLGEQGRLERLQQKLETWVGCAKIPRVRTVFSYAVAAEASMMDEKKMY